MTFSSQIFLYGGGSRCREFNERAWSLSTPAMTPPFLQAASAASPHIRETRGERERSHGRRKQITKKVGVAQKKSISTPVTHTHTRSSYTVAVSLSAYVYCAPWNKPAPYIRKCRDGIAPRSERFIACPRATQAFFPSLPPSHREEEMASLQKLGLRPPHLRRETVFCCLLRSVPRNAAANPIYT